MRNISREEIPGEKGRWELSGMEGILEAFFDGTIDRTQRDEQLGRVDTELKVYQGMVVKLPTVEPSVSTADLADVFSAFAEMPFLQRDDKRSLLRALGVQVSVRGYEICTLAMRSVGALGTNTDNRLKTGPSPSRAPPCRSAFRRVSC